MQPAVIVQSVVNTASSDDIKEWQQDIAAAKTLKVRGAEIIVDAARLKDFPIETIQQARVVLDVRNILKQNEWTP